MYCFVCNKNKYPIFLFNNKNYCINHSKLYFNNHITIIQKIYRGYKKRKYLHTVFYKLPSDLQKYILTFIIKNNANNNIKKYITKISYKINSIQNIENYEINLKELNIILSSFILYHNYININWKKYYIFYFENIHYILYALLNTQYTHSNVNINIFNSVNFYDNLLNDDFCIQSNIIIKKINILLDKLITD